jgi:hypothetical protein
MGQPASWRTSTALTRLTVPACAPLKTRGANVD